MLIKRYLDIASTIQDGKTLVILGPRRVGKTTLLENYMQSTQQKIAFYRGDDITTQELFAVADSIKLRQAIGSAAVLVLDEAQEIPDIGKKLKLINDTIPNVAVIATGSAAFELAGQVGEPLTGRKRTRYLFPVSLVELLHKETAPSATLQRDKDAYLLYGMYPDVLVAKSIAEKREFLSELVDAYLLRDILTFQEVKSSRVLLQLLSLLAYQIGNEVSLNELAGSLNIDKNTVARYLDLFEKSYIIYRLGGFSRNLRNEVTRTAKYYFYDTGVRNAVINNFSPLEGRTDVGQLWENFVITERLKARTYQQIFAGQYFWRTWQQQEIDLVEDRNGELFAYEIKLGVRKQPRAPCAWTEAYPTALWQVITPDNLYSFLGGDNK